MTIWILCNAKPITQIQTVFRLWLQIVHLSSSVYSLVAPSNRRLQRRQQACCLLCPRIRMKNVLLMSVCCHTSSQFLLFLRKQLLLAYKNIPIGAIQIALICVNVRLDWRTSLGILEIPADRLGLSTVRVLHRSIEEKLFAFILEEQLRTSDVISLILVGFSFNFRQHCCKSLVAICAIYERVCDGNHTIFAAMIL